MNIHELNRDQLIELKQRYLFELDECGEIGEVLRNDPDDDTGLTWGELANAEKIVTDEVLFDHYSGIEFCEEDFFA